MDLTELNLSTQNASKRCDFEKKRINGLGFLMAEANTPTHSI